MKKTRNEKLSDETIKSIAADFDKRAELKKVREELKNYSIESIAARHGVHLNTVRRVMADKL